MGATNMSEQTRHVWRGELTRTSPSPLMLDTVSTLPVLPLDWPSPPGPLELLWGVELLGVVLI